MPTGIVKPKVKIIRDDPEHTKFGVFWFNGARVDYDTHAEAMFTARSIAGINTTLARLYERVRALGANATIADEVAAMTSETPIFDRLARRLAT